MEKTKKDQITKKTKISFPFCRKDRSWVGNEEYAEFLTEILGIKVYQLEIAEDLNEFYAVFWTDEIKYPTAKSIKGMIKKIGFEFGETASFYPNGDDASSNSKSNSHGYGFGPWRGMYGNTRPYGGSTYIFDDEDDFDEIDMEKISKAGCQ